MNTNAPTIPIPVPAEMRMMGLIDAGCAFSAVKSDGLYRVAVRTRFGYVATGLGLTLSRAVEDVMSELEGNRVAA